VPLGLLVALAAQDALTAVGGVDAWLTRVRWEPGANFVGIVSAPSLYGGLLGYVSVLLALQVRGLVKALPQAGDFFQLLPGSFGVASRAAQEAQEQRDAFKSRRPTKPAAKQLPILLVSGPRGVGKTTLSRRLLGGDSRFRQPEWIATAPCDNGSSAHRTILEVADFEELRKSGSLAVTFTPYDEDGEQVNIGLPALSVITAAKEGACLLDVDPPTARALLSYDWSRALAAVYPGEDVELKFVSVWVSLSSLDAIIERNRRRMQADAPGSGAAVVERQLAPLRSQASADCEWMLTSGCFDFTLINEHEDEASKELENDAKYCFGDPF